jgi:hypothetical protein
VLPQDWQRGLRQNTGSLRRDSGEGPVSYSHLPWHLSHENETDDDFVTVLVESVGTGRRLTVVRHTCTQEFMRLVLTIVE